jgi:hypothetical protein
MTSHPDSSINKTIKYEASCQCRNVNYVVTTTALEEQEVTTCDCSICLRNSYVMVYVPREDVTWNSGYDSLKTFQFASKRNHHMFCPECGSSILIDPKGFYLSLDRFKGAPDILGINVCL